MKINILYGVEGAKKAEGLAVIIDVFRAFSLECYMMDRGAKKIIPVADKDLAYLLKERNPEFLLVGERNGKMLEGFDYGNSTTQMEKADLKDKIIVHTTSSGTQGLANAIHAKEVITGSLVNAKAIVEYIKQRGYEEVSLVCMGWNGKEQTDEDNLCAEYIKSMLENKEINMEEKISELKETNGAKFFDKEKQEIFPENDFYYCTAINKFNFVLLLKKVTDDIKWIQKVELKKQ